MADNALPGELPSGEDLAAYQGLNPGWYRDPADPAFARYWDGTSLSAERRPITPPPPSTLPPPPAFGTSEPTDTGVLPIPQTVPGKPSTTTGQPPETGPSRTSEGLWQTTSENPTKRFVPPPPSPTRAARSFDEAYQGLKPGWYGDPADPTFARYWDGTSLSAERRPITPPPASSTPPASPTSGTAQPRDISGFPPPGTTPVEARAGTRSDAEAGEASGGYGPGSRDRPDRAPLAGRSSLQNPVANPFAAPKGPERTVLSGSIAVALGWVVWLILFAEWFSVPSLTPQGQQGASPSANAASAIANAYGSAASGLLPNPHTALIVIAIIMMVCLVVLAVYFKQARISISKYWLSKELTRSRLKPLAWLSAAAIVGSIITIIAGVVPVNQVITGIYHAAKGCSRAGVSVGSCISYKAIVVAAVGVLALVGSAIALVASLFCLAYVRTAARYIEP